MTEAHLSSETRRRVLEVVERRAGLKLSPALASRLPAVVAETACRRGVSVDGFVAGLGLRACAGDLDDLIEALVVHETEFFRHRGQIRAIEETVLPEVMARAMADERAVRVWSAGCATGEEAYSLAVMLISAGATGDGGPGCDVLATDISPAVLDRAQAGQFPVAAVEGCLEGWGPAWFTRRGDVATVSSEVRRLVRFARLNLAADRYPKEQDLILCRNVLIYFSDDARDLVLDRFREGLRPSGWLVLGYSESLRGHDDRFERVDAGEAVVYRRREEERIGRRVRGAGTATAAGAESGAATARAATAESGVATATATVAATGAGTVAETVARTGSAAAAVTATAGAGETDPGLGVDGEERGDSDRVFLSMPTGDPGGLRRAVAAAIRLGAQAVVVDLDAAQFLTTRDARALEHASRVAAEHGVELTVVAKRPAMRAFAVRSDLDTLLTGTEDS